jgi:hypothetical protein
MSADPEWPSKVNDALLHLLGEMAAMRILVGLTLAHSPDALLDVRRLLPHIDDLSLFSTMTDPERVAMREALERMLVQVPLYQEALRKFRKKE